MKNCLIFIAFTVNFLSLSAQTTVQWSDSIVVMATSLPITSPRVTLLKDGTPLVTWGSSGTPSQIWCTRFENGGFTAPVGVVQDPNQPILFGFGGYDVAVSDSQVFIVSEQMQGGIYLSRSDDAGLSFGGASLVQGPVSGGYATLASVVVDGTGNPIVSFIREKNGATFEIRRSDDGGLNFMDPVTANLPAPGGAVCECCTSDLLTSGDSVWILFRNNNQNLRDIWVSRSTDLAATFDTAADVDATDWHINVCPIAGPRMARSNDSLITVWVSGAGGSGKVYLSTLHAGTMQKGQQFGFPSIPSLTAQSLPDITASGDTVGVVFLEKSKEIVFRYSTQDLIGVQSQGNRFAVPNHTFQYPSIAYRNGVFHLVYVDVTSDQVLYRQGKLTQSSSMNSPQANQPIQLFPNPADSGEPIRIVMSGIQSGEIRCALTDVYGKTVKEVASKELSLKNGGFELQPLGLPGGVYFLIVRINGIVCGTQKLVLR